MSTSSARASLPRGTTSPAENTSGGGAGNTARLLRKLTGQTGAGPDRALVGECPVLRSGDIFDRCNAHCPDLSALFAGGIAAAQHSNRQDHR
jgi:hypothetical protein